VNGWILRLHGWDERLLTAVVRRRRPRLDRFMRAMTRLCEPSAMLLTGILLLAGVIPIPDEIARDAAFSLLLSHCFVQILKRTVTRPRPVLPAEIESLAPAPDRFSFPSGHAAAALALALPIALWLPLPSGALVLALALVVGISRSYLGVHHPGDVLAGWALALLAALVVVPGG
jgi:undecaprenyl-diphosphatase